MVADIKTSTIPVTIAPGAVSYVLHSIGRMHTPTPSNELRRYGESGPGRWITVYASQGHSFIVIAGLRFDTGYGSGQHGPNG